ncbi:carboxypeptidase-like regulatory domain-containing protein [Catellatospora sp. KI3]|uniref:carboxypeptidase-like regulatory domain-containing protein n=1 Tax=Catellatospora sp. KI3 TaxID=3041620 RepID=UPI00248275C5|nr:carboxypeptidase-like regulatory domain-containing protein [Catellatospora sp. KI3]MDI1463775.1 carboxypeptidase-like regulatory domain-containing protein [Catellatospora sp. KI3]
MRYTQEPGPLARASALLLASLAEVDVAVQVEHPGAVQGVQAGAYGGPWLAVWPYAVLPESLPARAGDPLRLRVRFLLHADGPGTTPVEVLDRVLTAGVPYLLAEAVPDSLWPALGARLRMALLCEVPVQQATAAPYVPRVTQPPRLETTSLRSLSGRVVTVDGVPLARMRVAVADQTAAAYTDNSGHFTLPAVAADRPLRLLVTGRGLQLSAEVAAVSADPVVITCEILEV